MNGVLALVAAAAVGIDIGWEPLPEGGFEYIIQIEPQTLESMKRGQPIGSQLPPAVRGMRAYRIIVGDGAVPHEGEPLPVEAARASTTEQPMPAGAPGGAAGSTGAAQATPAMPGPDPHAAPPGVAAEAGPSDPASKATPARDSSGVASRAPLRGGSAAQDADQVPAIPAVSGQDERSGTAPPELTPDAGQKDLREHTASYVQGANRRMRPHPATAACAPESPWQQAARRRGCRSWAQC